MAKMIAAYSGSAIQGATAATGGTTTDIGFTASGKVDTAAADAASAININKWYDQSGNANDLTNDGVNRRPILRTSQSLRGTCPIIFGGNDLTQPIVAQNLQTAATLSLNKTSMTVYLVHAPRKSLQSNLHFSFRAAGTEKLTGFTFLTNPGLSCNDNGSTVNSNIMPRANLSVHAYSCGASSRSIYVNDTRVDLAVGSSATVDQLSLGQTPAGAAFRTCDQYLAIVVYPAAHTPAEAQTVKDALTSIYSVQKATDYTNMLIADGDSINEGTGATLNIWEQADLPTWEVYNMGVFGQKLSDAYTARVARFSGLIADGISRYGAGKVVFSEEAACNDIIGGDSAATVYTARTNMKTYVSGLGAKTVGADIIINTALTAPQETERLAFNVSNAANAAGYDAIVDIDSTTVAKYDGVHPTTAGDATLAPIYTSAIVSV